MIPVPNFKKEIPKGSSADESACAGTIPRIRTRNNETAVAHVTEGRKRWTAALGGDDLRCIAFTLRIMFHAKIADLIHDRSNAYAIRVGSVLEKAQIKLLK